MKYLFLIPFLIVFNSFSASSSIDPADLPLSVSRNGNTYIFTTTDGKNYSKNTLFTSAGIQHNSPILSAESPMPYANKGGSSAKLNLSASIDPKKVASKAASAISAAAGALASSPYVTVAAIGCSVFCDSLIAWGIDKLNRNSDGSFSLNAPDLNAPTSTGVEWYGPGNPGQYFPTLSQAGAYHAAYLNTLNGYNRFSVSGTGQSSYTLYDTTYNTYSTENASSRPSSCPSGWYLNSSGCSQNPPTVSQPLETYLESNYKGKGWNSHWASMTAQILKDGGNVFTDGTSADITGPVTIPVSDSETKTGVTLISGTTNIAPQGYTGATDPGTQTTTTTTTARNTFSPAPLSSGSSSSAPSGPSMTTTTEKLTTTSITNNITNTTNIVNQSTEKSEEPPEEEVKDTPLGPIPDLYKQKYPNGLKGVVTQKIEVLKATPLFSLPMQLMGNLPDTGNCPSWQLDLNLATWANFGTHNIGADCSVWQFASVVVLISAFILARALVFGG